MKKLIFKEVLICSHKERRAKKVKFDPIRTLIYGKNDTGKSSLIKTLFITFGANPGKVNNSWKRLNPISLVKFQVDNENYSIVKDGNFYGIFDDNDILIRGTSSITNGLAPFLAELFNFKIKLTDKNGNTITPTPAFIFLPFYIDQDTSWNANWNAFSGIQQFKRPREPIVLYHTGIRPNEYYETKAEIMRYEDEILKLDNEQKIINGILKNVRNKITEADFNIDIEQFKEEVKQLLIQCESLKKIEEKNKEKLVDLHNHRIVLETQMEIAFRAKKEAEKDYQYAINKVDSLVECPTCGAEYDNSFSERFAIAIDTDRCAELIHELSGELETVQAEIQKENDVLTTTLRELEEIEAILRSKKGEIVLKDVIENAGRNEIKKVFDSQIRYLTETIQQIAIRQKDLKDQIKLLEDKKRKALIVDFYRRQMNNNLRDLEVYSLRESDYRNISCKINDTGSSLPRALTAYYFSLFETIKNYSSSLYAPLVIDSPNQQAQDPEHIEKILRFIKDNQPSGSQLILGLEELYNMEFNCPIVEVTNKYNLLDHESFSDVSSELQSYLTQIVNMRGHMY